MKRIGVAVEIWSDSARPLIRTAATLARTLGSAWTAIVVCDPAHRLPVLPVEQRQLFDENARLISWLGGTPFICEGDDVAATLAVATKVTAVDMLLVGRPRRHGICAWLLSDRVSTRLLHGDAHVPLMFAEVVWKT